MKERWRYIPGYEGMYKASTLGRIKSVSRRIKYSRWGDGCIKTTNDKILSPSISKKSPYYKVVLSNEGVVKTKLCHRLIALTFKTNHHNKPCVNHKNGNKKDNRPINLEWCDHLYNKRHAVKKGLVARGERHGMTKYSDKLKKKIFNLFATGETTNQRKLSKKFKISTTHINRIVNQEI